MIRSLSVALVLIGVSSSAFAQQQPQFAPITLDMPKITELLDEVAMTNATRQAMIKIVTRWEQEAQQVQQTKADTPETHKEKSK